MTRRAPPGQPDPNDPAHAAPAPATAAEGLCEMPRPLRLDRLSRAAPHAFEETASEAERAAIARLLGAREVGRLRFSGRLVPLGATDWRLEGRLLATIVQSCVVSLLDVAQRIDLQVSRLYAADLPEDLAVLDIDTDPSVDDDPPEPLPRTLDLGAIAIEEAALALDPYPRHESAAIGLHGTEGAGAEAAPDSAFAALAALKAKLERDS
ncbi:MAG: YceD family protein [Pseudomonadota bacterium]